MTEQPTPIASGEADALLLHLMQSGDQERLLMMLTSPATALAAFPHVTPAWLIINHQQKFTEPIITAAKGIMILCGQRSEPGGPRPRIALVCLTSEDGPRPAVPRQALQQAARAGR